MDRRPYSRAEIRRDLSELYRKITANWATDKFNLSLIERQEGRTFDKARKAIAKEYTFAQMIACLLELWGE